MGASFSDITLYIPTSLTSGTAEYWEEHSLINFVSDLYVQNMNGYKPPKTSRITIQPAFHGIWDKTLKIGSIISIAPFFNHEEFYSLERYSKYKYILNLIQTATLQLSDEYNWDKAVFKNAYYKTLECNFDFRIQYPSKQSRDKKKSGVFVIKKTHTTTSVYVEININDSIITKKLFDKKNSWWHDCAYVLAKYNKWFDNDRFGVGFGKGKIDFWYSVNKNNVELYEDGSQVSELNFKKYFLFG